jgi:hypothetical protein
MTGLTFRDPPEPRRWTARTLIVLALAACGALALLAWWLWPVPTPSVTPPSDQAVVLPPAVSEAPSLEIPDTAAPADPVVQRPARPAIKAIPKTPEVRAKLKLPPALFDGPETFIMATGSLQSEDDRAYTLSSLLDRRTGETSVHAVAEPLPMFSLAMDHGAAGVYYGIKDGQPVFRGALSQEVFRIQRARAGGTLQLDSDGAWFAGVGVEVRW